MDTEPDESGQPADHEGDGQEYVDRSKIDFDPDDGLLTGTALEGTSDIPGSTSADRDDKSDGDAPQADEQSETDPETADPEPA